MTISNNYDLDLLRLYGTQGTQGVNSNGKFAGEDSEASIGIGAQEAQVTNYDQLESEYAEAAEAAGVTGSKGASGAQAASGANATSAASGATSKEIKEEIEKLEEEKAENIEKMEEIEDHIEQLADEAEKQITAAAAAQDEAVKEHEEEVQSVVSENLQAYIDANKEGGEGMTREELQENIKGAMPDLPQVGEAVAALTAASELVDEIDSCLGELNQLIEATQKIDDLITAKEGEYEAALKAEQEAAKNKCCDPIGFVTEDADGNQAQYDFIVDDGAFDSTSDFLGANGQWSAMAALDTSGDGIVDAQELAAGNIKAVKTDANGNKSIVDLAEEFGDDFSIDLNSYQKGGSHSAIDAGADANGNGVADQSLLGTFNLNIGGQTVSGYNTLDDTEWLADNYGIAGEDPMSSPSDVQDTKDATKYSADLQSHVNFYNFYTEYSAQLRSEIEDGFTNIGVNEDQMKDLEEVTRKEADQKAQNFFASLGVEEEDMTEENTVANTDTVTSDDEDEKREEELELRQAA